MQVQLKTILSISLGLMIFGLPNPVRAQWDLSNGSATDALNAAGPGNVGAGALGSQNSNNAGQSINQTYTMGTNAMPANHLPTQYNHVVGGQSGFLNNVWGQNQNVAAQAAGQRLPLANNAQFGLQNMNLPLNLKGTFNGLPPTSLDSFVKNAGGAAERIYGDEGTTSWPPLNGFGRQNTINAGIVGQRNKTITTGHGGETLPTASGNGTEKAP